MQDSGWGGNEEVVGEGEAEESGGKGAAAGAGGGVSDGEGSSLMVTGGGALGEVLEAKEKGHV